MSDRDHGIVVRNFVMLLVVFAGKGHDETVDCMVHVWYSAFIRESDLQLLSLRVRPLIGYVCHKIRDKPSKTIFGKTWKFGQSSFRLVLGMVSLDRLLTFLEVPSGLTVEKANLLRTAVTLANSRVDYRD